MDIVTYALCKKMAGGKGEKGDKGDKGDQGLPGRDGVDGVTPNLQVGDVVTLEAGQQASITRRGDDENPIFDFAIPKGDTGKDGIFVGRVDDAPDHAQVVVNDDASPYDLFFENANVSYMGDTYTSLKEKSDADIEYLLREIQTQHYEGQRITATNTYQKQVKSAILKGVTKGQQLLNSLLEIGSISGGTGEVSSDSYRLRTVDFISINPDETYTAYAKSINVRLIYYYSSNKTLVNTSGTGNVEKTLTFKTPSNCSYIKIVYAKTNLSSFDDANYEVGLQNGDTYYETLTSVKMPVLKSIGKNLFDKTKITKDMKLLSTGVTSSETGTSISDFIQVLSNENYYLDYGNTYTSRALCFYDENKSFISGLSSQYIINFTTPTNCKYVRFNIASIESDNVQLELGSTKTAYEPYKSNILTVNEEVELRGIGDVKDELNLLTGEVVERVSEIVLDGSEEWNVSGHSNWTSCYTRKYILPHLINKGTSLVSDKMMSYIYYDYLGNNDVIGISVTNEGYICFKYLPNGSKPQPSEVSDYLKSNPITIQYPLETDSIKTVDLNNQKVYSYDGTTHYTTSSGVEGHPAPILSIDVPTNLPALVSRQRDTIKDLEKENEALKEEVAVVDQQRESGDLELLSSDFDLDFRLMEIEFVLDIPIAATFKEVRNMARTPYEMAKILILGGKYERSDMEYKLGKYLERKQITQAQYDELIALMEANELVV